MKAVGRRAKADRLLVEGRLRVVKVDPESGLVVARVRGEKGEYDLGFDPRRREWRCTCPASRTFYRHKPCSHLLALQTVTKGIE